MACRDILKIKVSKLSLYFLEDNQKIGTGRTEEQLAGVEKEIIDLIKEMENSKFSPTGISLSVLRFQTDLSCCIEFISKVFTSLSCFLRLLHPLNHPYPQQLCFSVLIFVNCATDRINKVKRITGVHGCVKSVFVNTSVLFSKPYI